MSYTFLGTFAFLLHSSLALATSQLSIQTYGAGNEGVGGAKVIVTESGGKVLTGITDGLGNLTFPQVDLGKFRLEITAKNYEIYSDSEPEIKPGNDHYLYRANLNYLLPDHDPKNPILSSSTFPFSEISAHLPHVFSATWPFLSEIFSNLIPRSDTVFDDPFRQGQISATTVNYDFMSALKIKWKENSQHEFQPTLEQTHELSHGPHLYTFGRDASNPREQENVTPKLTKLHAGNEESQVFSVNLISAGEKDIYVTAPYSEIAFEYGPHFCMSNGVYVTDPLVIWKDGCDRGEGEGSLVGFHEDIVSRFNEETVDKVKLHYRLKKYWLVVTSTPDGKPATKPSDITVHVEALPLLVSGKSGNAIAMKDFFSSTVDSLLSYENKITITDSAGKPIVIEKAKVFHRMSDDLYQQVKTLSAGGENIIPQSFALETGNGQFMSLLALRLSYLRGFPSNYSLTWNKLPWPTDLPITAETYYDLNTRKVSTRFNGAPPPEPTGTFTAALKEFETEAETLGTGKITQMEAFQYILEAQAAGITSGK